MEKRIQASEHTRQTLSALIEGRLSSPDARADLVKLATRLIVEEALEAESRDALGRAYYEHGAKPGQGYRNGHRRGRLKTAEGFVEYAAPQIAGREEGFRSEIRAGLKGRTEGLEELVVELLARGLSVRDIEDTFTDENGRLLLSRTAVSELGERLWEDYALCGVHGYVEFATRKPLKNNELEDERRYAVDAQTKHTRRASVRYTQALGGDGAFSDARTRQVPRRIQPDDAGLQLQTCSEFAGRSCIHGVLSAKTAIEGEWRVNLTPIPLKIDRDPELNGRRGDSLPVLLCCCSHG